MRRHIFQSLFILSFFLVNCEGTVGPQGDQGEQGTQGEKGEQGEQGIQGDKGDKGESYYVDPSEQLFITRVRGNNQTYIIRTTLSSFEVLVTDGNGFPIEDTRVDWEIIEGEGSLPYETTITSNSGKTSIQLTFGEAIGEVKVKATVFGSGEFVIFTVTAYTAKISIYSGDNMTGIVSSSPDSTRKHPEEFVVYVTDNNDIIRQGMYVIFTIMEGSVKSYVSPGGASADSEGFASTYIYLYNEVGNIKVKAKVNNTNEYVIFNFTAISE